MKKPTIIIIGLFVILSSILIFTGINADAVEINSEIEIAHEYKRVECPYLSMMRETDNPNENNIEFMTLSVNKENRDIIAGDLLAINGVTNVWLSETCPNTVNTLIKLTYNNEIIGKSELEKSVNSIGVEMKEIKECPYNKEQQNGCPYKNKSENKEVRS